MEFAVEERHINRSVWVTPTYYQDLSPIGTGAYGSVCSASDMRTGQRVAIKKLHSPFQDKVNGQRTLREIRLLRYIVHDNVIGLRDLFLTQATGAAEADVYIVTELMGSDLHGIIQSQMVSNEHVKFFIYQILRALMYIHSAGIIHRDLKPSNVAINEDSDLKILDFGLARKATLDGGMTGYVATRWYRAPEIMLNWGDYTHTVDMWSVGCIMAELLTSKPLFPGEDYVEQIRIIMQLLGKPDVAYVASLNDSVRSYIDALPQQERLNFSECFVGLDPLAIDLLDKLLVFDPHSRLTAADAIRHPYLASYHDPEDEPVAPGLFDFSFDDLELSVDGWRQLVYQEIASYRQFAAELSAAADRVAES